MGLALVRLGLGLVLGLVNPAEPRNAHGVHVMAGGPGTGAAGAGVGAGAGEPC